MVNHPFAGSKGSRFRTRIATQLFASQLGKCNMCGNPISPTLKGKANKQDAVVDHIIPWRMQPDLSYVPSNLQLICRACHSVCHSIEQRHAGPASIAQAKQSHRPVGLDGYRVGGG